MRDAAKINIDNTIAEEQDKDWARNFLYPDLRPAYKLFYNKEGYEHALDLVAKARAAWRIEEAESKAQQQTSQSFKRTTVNGKPATPEQEKDIDATFKEMDDVFKGMDKMFKSVSKRMDRIFKRK